MVDDIEEFLAYVTQLHAEHVALDQRTHRITEELSGKSDEDIAPVVRDLEVLRADLASHFEEEEAGGCLDQAVSRRPQLGPEADQLTSEHSQLLARLQRLVDKSKELPARRWTDYARQEFREFAKQLRSHESAESRILEESFGLDLE